MQSMCTQLIQYSDWSKLRNTCSAVFCLRYFIWGNSFPKHELINCHCSSSVCILHMRRLSFSLECPKKRFEMLPNRRQWSSWMVERFFWCSKNDMMMQFRRVPSTHPHLHRIHREIQRELLHSSAKFEAETKLRAYKKPDNSSNWNVSKNSIRNSTHMCIYCWSNVGPMNFNATTSPCIICVVIPCKCVHDTAERRHGVSMSVIVCLARMKNVT